MNKNPTTGDTPSAKIDARIKELDDWRGKTLARLRARGLRSGQVREERP